MYMVKVIIKKMLTDTLQVYLENEDNLSINYHREVLHTFKEALTWCMKILEMEDEENV